MTTAKHSTIQFKTLFWAFSCGVVVALVLAACAALWISKAPVPFVSKVQQVEQLDPTVINGQSVDPNAKLYAEGQGIDPATSVAPVNAVGVDESAAPIDTNQFWVQAGAFSQNADAESMRARIAFIGLDAQISHRLESGQRLYRVRIGPFDKVEQADEIKQSLADNAIQGTVMRLKN